jgi:hypothetical protein
VDGLGRRARPEHLGVGRSSQFTLVYFFFYLFFFYLFIYLFI